ncbi:MAG: autotransporter assembly complex protein TamA, partial [Advenella sp.]
MRLNKACFLTTILLLAGFGQVSAQKPEVIIDPSGLGPESLDAVNKGISAVVRMADDQDSGEADRIRRKGREAVISALATRGYFAPDVTLEVGEDVGGETWDISID